MSSKFVAQLAGCGKEAKAEGAGAFLEQQLASNCIKNHGSTALQGALQVKCCRKQQSPEQLGYVNRTEMKLILGKKLC